jgi:endonuclease/exonuclease/phosphatase family metal-dependent hydrolase
MTWNLWWRFGGAWREREPGILATLETYRPDLVGLVETWAGDGTSQAERLGDALTLDSVFVPTSLPPAPDPVESPDQNGIAVGIGLLSRWRIVATEVHELPHTQRGGAPPTAFVSTVDHPRGPLHVVVACTEWEPEYAGDQLEQSRALAALAAQKRFDGRLPVLLIGDLNAAVDQPELAPVTETMVDTWTAGGGDPDAVTYDSTMPLTGPGAVKQLDRRIDHVFARPGHPGRTVTVHRAFLAGDRPVDGVYPSDHYAVGVDLDP